MSTLNMELNSLFIHVMKCAGSSMTRGWNGGDIGHETLMDFHAKMDTTRFFKWSFVRNPWDRLVSVYEYCPELKAFGSFREVVDELYANRDIIAGSGMKWNEAKGFGRLLHFERLHVYPQMRCLSIGYKMAMDFVGRVESLEQDWALVCTRLGVPCDTLPHEKRQDYGPYQSYYTPDLINKVGAIYWQDALGFNYCFE